MKMYSSLKITGSFDLSDFAAAYTKPQRPCQLQVRGYASLGYAAPCPS